MASARAFAFEAPLEMTGGSLPAYIVVVPPSVLTALGVGKGTRVRVRLNGSAPQAMAFNPLGTGQIYLRVGRALHKAMGQPSLGTAIQVTGKLDTSTAVDVPAVLQAALAQEPAALDAFHHLTPGKQRSAAYYISSAKSEAVQIKRSLELVQGLLADGLANWPPKRSR